MGRRKAKRKRRLYTEHRGVKILRRVRDGREFFIGRWRDPATGAWREASLTAQGKTNDESRREWAKDKSKEIQGYRAGKVIENITVTEAVHRFLESKKGSTRPSTLRQYTEGLRPFLQWAALRRIKHCPDLVPEVLPELRDFIASLRAQVQVEGAGKHAFEFSDQPLAAATRNTYLRLARMLLDWVRARGYARKLTGDALRDHLKAVPSERKAIRFLEVHEIKALLHAAGVHDAQTWAMTRDEHRMGVHGPRSATPKYKPIRPLVYAALLTGMRFDELVNLSLDEVLSGAGKIQLPETRTKSRQARSIDLAVCPTLTTWLHGLKLRGAANRYVFGLPRPRKGGAVEYTPMTRAEAETARRRLMRGIETPDGLVAAPAFTWHDLRRTCGTFLTCAPGIYGGASAALSAKRLGHEIAVAERYYLGTLTSIPREAVTLEQAMGIEPLPRSTRRRTRA